MTNKNEHILAELEKARKEIKTDHYQMSIGELISLYKEGELKLNPTYQRLFRWKDENKTRFIESLILGIPIPPIFVAQKEDGKWDIVDGLQRISTILQLTGDLKSGNIVPEEDKLGPQEDTIEDDLPSDDTNKDWKLTACKYIPSIEGSTWKSLPSEVTRLIKRARISVSIVLTENSIRSQYELFQRLNTGGIQLSKQEIRNCLIIMSDNELYETLEENKKNKTFDQAIRQNPERMKEEIGMELLLRYLIAKHDNFDKKNYNLSNTLFSDFIDSETLNLIKDDKFIAQNEIDLLINIIERLDKVTGGHTFLKYNFKNDRFLGPFSVAIYEAILPGLANNWSDIEKLPDSTIFKAIKDLQKHSLFLKATKNGTKSLKRFFLLNRLSLEFFGKL